MCGLRQIVFFLKVYGFSLITALVNRVTYHKKQKYIKSIDFILFLEKISRFATVNNLVRICFRILP